jgi:DNA-binding XRE family transcriptional regulator/phosphoribosyl-ATP pyrophosphohydrolase
MKCHDYLKGVNNTFKHDDMAKEVLHCTMAIPEELGEIMGWLKKHYAYGKSKDERWKLEVTLELGDLLYYTTKLAELSNNLEIVEGFFEENVDVEVGKLSHEVIYTARMMRETSSLVECSSLSDEVKTSLMNIMYFIMVFAHSNKIELEDIIVENLRKLEVRHGNSFNIDSILEEGRDREAEANAGTVMVNDDPIEDFVITKEMSMKIRALRREKGLKQYEVALMCGISPTTISQIETGSITQSEQFSFVLGIAKALDVDVKQIIS